MPYILRSGSRNNEFLGEPRDYKYDYPVDNQGHQLDFTPGSDLHQKIVDRLVNNYAINSARVIAKRHDVWREMDDKLIGYIELSEKEIEIKARDPRKPVSIVFPYTYAILETLISYMVTAFFPEPMFRYEGNGPEDVPGAYLLQALINLHCVRNKVALNLHTFFRDINAYGVGVVSPQWRVDRGVRHFNAPIGFLDPTGVPTVVGTERSSEPGVLFEGNILENIDPYRYLPDPTVSIHDVQRGQFVGWVSTENYMDLLSQEQYQEDIELFNVRYLRHLSHKYSTIFGESAIVAQSQRFHNVVGGINLRDEIDSVDLLNIYVKLIPEEWELGDGEYPEKWLFTVGNDSILLRAKPLGLDHGMFPVCVSAPDFDGYSPVAHSRLEIIKGMQTVVDWMFNSHVANVRKAINDTLIVDPLLVNMRDLEDPEPGKLVRLRRPAWGKGITNAVYQLAVTDITSRNMSDVQLIVNYMQQAAGTDDATMGNLRQSGPERLTGAEFKGTAQGAISRLSRMAKMVGVQGMQDIGYMFAYHAQQLMTQESYVKAVGTWPQKIMDQLGVTEERARVTPEAIQIAYDLLVRDGSIPGGTYLDEHIQLFKIINENPALAQKFDIFRYFEFIATNAGAKNIDDFRAKPGNATLRVAPDEQVMQQAQAGNLVPVAAGGVAGGSNGTVA